MHYMLFVRHHGSTYWGPRLHPHNPTGLANYKPEEGAPHLTLYFYLHLTRLRWIPHLLPHSPLQVKPFLDGSLSRAVSKGAFMERTPICWSQGHIIWH